MSMSNFIKKIFAQGGISVKVNFDFMAQGQEGLQFWFYFKVLSVSGVGEGEFTAMSTADMK